MFVDVEFPVASPPMLVVPADAIVDSGLRKTVFVHRGDGYFEPRLVETGSRIGDDVEVTNGLVPGERIVISGTFFIDSESRMKAPARAAAAAPVVDPVCGMDVQPGEAGDAGRTAAHGGHVFFFCSDHCRQRFVADPSHYAKQGVAKP
jgi:Cu(I)/Ag(I) efflux system membrane fusion protein